MTKLLKAHPAADSFPMLEKNRLTELIEDIRQHGQREPITLCDGMILDGRNRYQACQELGIEPKTKTFDGDPWAYVWSLNGQRRDLVAEQRYLIWKFCNEHSEAFQAEKRRITEQANKKRAEAQAGIPKAEIKERAGTECPPTSKHPERKAKAHSAKVNMGAVARGDKLAKERPDLAEKVRMGEVRPADAHREMKRQEHKEKLKAAPALPTLGPSEVILADPPWQYEHQQAGNRAIENQYPTMKLEDIMIQKPKTATDAILFLWATAPQLANALRVMYAWEFKYVTHAVWDKEIIGMGYWFRGQHEILLVGVKGKPGTPPECERVSSIFKERRSKHSQKPECVYQWVERSFPDKRKLEMYCRKPRTGWMTWGNEV